ncbi:MAG: type II secretion system protein [Solirubrobacterales bacterium]
MLRRVRDRAGDEAGFSLPEVLVVMMIMGILIAINVGPGFNGCNGQPARSADLEARAVARSAAATMEAYANDNLGAYDGASPATLHAMNSNVPSNMEVFGYANCTGDPGGDTCFSVRTHSSITPTGNRFQLIKKVDGKLESHCTVEGAGACPVGGKWSAE